MRMRRSRKRGGEDPSAHVLFSSQRVDLGDAELSGLLGWAAELLDSSWVCPLPQRTEKRGMSEDSKDVGRGLIPTVKRFLQLGTERRTDGGGNGTEVCTGLCSVAIYPAQWSRTSTLAAEDKKGKRSGQVHSPLFKQRIPRSCCMCALCRAIT